MTRRGLVLAGDASDALASALADALASAGWRVGSLAAPRSADEAAFEAAFDRVLEETGELGALVLLLRLRAGRPVADGGPGDWQGALFEPLACAFLAARRATEELVGAGAGGRVLLVLDAPAEPGTLAATQQAALVSLARSISTEYGRTGITCNVLIASDHQRGIEAVIETGRFLLSDDAAYVTAQVMDLTGGSEVAPLHHGVYRTDPPTSTPSRPQSRSPISASRRAPMLTEFQRKKMAALYRMFDADGNGVIQKADFERMAKNLADARELKPSSPDRDKIVSKYGSAWTLLHKMADADKDGAITGDEWIAALTTIIGSPEAYDSVVGMLADLVFDTFDTDRDNYVQADEFKAFVEARRVPNASPAAAFARLDADGDGKLSRTDVMRLAGEYFKSDDPKAAGNSLFGQV